MGSMLVTNHVLHGAALGLLVRRPAATFAVAVASHFAADALPHWGGTGTEVHSVAFLKVAVPDGLLGLALMGAAVARTPPRRRAAVLSGMVGAALPDLDKPFALVTRGRRLWPAPVTRLHSAVQREAPHRMTQEVAAGCALAAVLAGLSARRPRG